MNFQHEIEIDTSDFAIGGKLIRGSIVIPIDTLENTNFRTDEELKEQIRKDLAYRLAEQILQNKLCEITQRDDPVTLSKHIMMRCYLAPNDQVKILRVYNANIQHRGRN